MSMKPPEATSGLCCHGRTASAGNPFAQNESLIASGSFLSYASPKFTAMRMTARVSWMGRTLMAERHIFFPETCRQVEQVEQEEQCPG